MVEHVVMLVVKNIAGDTGRVVAYPKEDVRISVEKCDPFITVYAALT